LRSFTQDPDSDFAASFPDFPGCTGHIGVMREAREPCPHHPPSTSDKRPTVAGRCRVSGPHRRAGASEFKLTGPAWRPETIGFHLLIRYYSPTTILIGQSTPRLCCQGTQHWPRRSCSAISRLRELNRFSFSHPEQGGRSVRCRFGISALFGPQIFDILDEA
jgi:hypothetical protein